MPPRAGDAAATAPSIPVAPPAPPPAASESGADTPVTEARAVPPPPRVNTPATRPSAAPGARSVTGPLPRTLEEMPQDFKAGLPRLRLDVLMYSDVSDEALVFINGRKYTAGQSVEGLTLESIRREGVVLSHRGERFLLKAQ